MDLELTNKRALVTASGRGIGRAAALSLAREGCRVVVISRTKKDLQDLTRKMEGGQERHINIVMDLCAEGSPRKLVSQMRSFFGFPDIVVHNLGGTLNIKDPFCPVKDWRKMYRLNFEVAVELNRMLIPLMQRQRWGRVIHISSIAGMENQGPVTYCAMKAALTAYTRSFGGVVAPDGVVVSTVLPGAVFTEKGYWDLTSRQNPKHVKKFLKERQRIGRFGTTQEIADFVTFLCSPIASFNTGSIIPIDGGQGRGYFGQ